MVVVVVMMMTFLGNTREYNCNYIFNNATILSSFFFQNFCHDNTCPEKNTICQVGFTNSGYRCACRKGYTGEKCEGNYTPVTEAVIGLTTNKEEKYGLFLGDNAPEKQYGS